MPEAYPHTQVVPTRWHDNDVYGHVNNTVHYLAMDTVINAWLVEHAGLELSAEATGPIGLCVESGCRYIESMAYPDAMVVGLRVGHVGSSSVRWEVAIDRQSDGARVAEGFFVHVFVDRSTRRPQPLTDEVQRSLVALGHHG